MKQGQNDEQQRVEAVCFVCEELDNCFFVYADQRRFTGQPRRVFLCPKCLKLAEECWLVEESQETGDYVCLESVEELPSILHLDE